MVGCKTTPSGYVRRSFRGHVGIGYKVYRREPKDIYVDVYEMSAIHPSNTQSASYYYAKFSKGKRFEKARVRIGDDIEFDASEHPHKHSTTLKHPSNIKVIVAHQTSALQVIP